MNICKKKKKSEKKNDFPDFFFLKKKHNRYSEKIVQLPHSFFLTSYPEGFGHVLDAKVQEVMTEVSLFLQFLCVL